jgi:hypothetical protein
MDNVLGNSGERQLNDVQISTYNNNKVPYLDFMLLDKWDQLQNERHEMFSDTSRIFIVASAPEINGKKFQ